VTELKREVALYSTGTSKVESWVQIPFIDNTADKDIWCQYGGPTVANSTAVWSDISALAVYHLQSNANDSTGNGKDGVVVNAVNAAAKIQNGYTFDGNGDYITVSSNISFAYPWTLSAWVYPNTVPGNNLGIFSKSNSHNSNDGELDWFAGTSSNKPLVQWFGSTSTYVEGNTSPTAGQWNHLAATFDGTNVRLYLNGVLDKTGTPSVPQPSLSIATYIGAIRPFTTIYDLAGKLDELKIIGAVKSTDWIATEYANQNAPATFSTCGPESSGQTSKEYTLIMWMPGI
jgi:hypothetical protein